MTENTKDRATCWSLTINNPTQADDECIAQARQKGWKVDGQLERGEGGTLHYQIMLRTPQVRFSAVKKQFPRANISQARNPNALQEYVHKEETRVGSLPNSERYPSLTKFWQLLVLKLDEWNYINISYVFNPRWERDDHTFWWKEAPDRYRRDPLHALDEVTALLIEDGYYVEGLACNPQVRMAWRKFHAAIACRVYTDKDRQTDIASSVPENNVAVVDIPTHATPSASSPRRVLEGIQPEEEGRPPGSPEDEASDEDSDQGDCEASRP